MALRPATAGAAAGEPQLFRDVHSFLENAMGDLSRIKDQLGANELHHREVCDSLRKDLEQERSDGRDSTNRFRYEFDELVHQRVQAITDGLEQMEQSQKYKDKRQQQQLDCLEGEVRTLKASLGGVGAVWAKFQRKSESRQPLFKGVPREGFAVPKKSTRGSAVDEIKKLQQKMAANHLFAIAEQMRVRMKGAAQFLAGENWQTVFKAQDKDGSGQLDFPEFKSMCLEYMRIHEPDTNLRVVFESLDEDRSGEISIDELVQFVSDPLVRMRNRLRAKIQDEPGPGGRSWEDMIREQDKDESGQINFTEFKVMCRSVLRLLDREVQLRTVFRALDMDSSGEVSIEEFIAWVKAEGKGV